MPLLNDLQGESLLFAVINSVPIIPVPALDGSVDLIQRIVMRGSDLNFLSQEVSCVKKTLISVAWSEYNISC